ncbi:MAG: BREX system ATP-binding domain-containing protein [Capsulimonadaceae bacterium]
MSKPSCLTLSRWLDAITRDYLDDYVRSGGSAVKVVSGADALMDETIRRIGVSATSGGYFYAHLDPSRYNRAGKRPDLHRIDNLFFTATREVDWKAWAAIQAGRYLENHGIHLAPDRALGDLEGIAADNGRDAQDLLNQYQRELATPQLRDPRLAVEFRAAVTALSRALLIPDAVSPTAEEVLLGWFTGKTAPGAATALKRLQVLERINVGNARTMLTSFCRWLPQAGHDGLVLTLDFRPYEFKKLTKAQRQAEQLQQVRIAIARGATADELTAIAAEHQDSEPAICYSDPAYMQMLTMIRRFIDEVDAFERFLLVIVSSPDFYKDKSVDTSVKRCYYDYDALQTRIGQEVHDARYANPAAALVHLGGE